jgi:hypothetical protein
VAAEHCSFLVAQSKLEVLILMGQDLQLDSEPHLVAEERNPFVLSSLEGVRCPRIPHRQFEVVERCFAGAGMIISRC